MFKTTFLQKNVNNFEIQRQSFRRRFLITQFLATEALGKNTLVERR